MLACKSVLMFWFACSVSVAILVVEAYVEVDTDPVGSGLHNEGKIKSDTYSSNNKIPVIVRT